MTAAAEPAPQQGSGGAGYLQGCASLSVSPPAQLPQALPPPQNLGSKQSLAGDTPGQPEARAGLETCLSSLGSVVWVGTQDSPSQGPQWGELWRAPSTLDCLQTLIPSTSGFPSLRSSVQTRVSTGAVA